LADNSSKEDQAVSIHKTREAEQPSGPNFEQLDENEQVSLETPPGGTISKFQKK